MSIDLFRVMQGLNVQLDDLSAAASLLVGTGLPGGDGDIQDAAAVGSIYQRNDAAPNGNQIYYKWTTVNNSSADWKIIPDVDYVDAVAAGLSWREPVRVRDGSLYANSAAFPLTGTIDGVSLNDGDRVLFSNVTNSAHENVWIWDSGSPASWTEDTNQETDGDAVLVQEGTSADQQWVYDGTNWVQFGSGASTAELGYIRDYIGKTGPGAEFPTYSSTNVVTQSNNLETAIGELDAAFGSGDITNTAGNYPVTSDYSWFGGANSITDATNQLNNAIGNRNYTENNFVTDGQTITASIEALDVQVGYLSTQTNVFTGTNVVVSGTVTVDTIPLTDATEAKWIVQVRETATPANRRAAEIHAMNDGSTTVDHTTFAVLSLGSAIAAINFNVDISGGNMRLRLTATNNLDYVVKRIAYTAF